jgi:hypothetical protein
MMVRLAINELELVWKEAMMVLFEVQSRCFRGETDENQKNLRQDNWSLSRDLNTGLPEYEVRQRRNDGGSPLLAHPV